MKIVYSLIWLCMLTSTLCKGQPSAFIYTDSLPQQISLLDKGWKWHAGDNYDWAKPTLDDRSWESINPADDIPHLPQVRDAQVGWFRLNLRVPPSKKQLAMAVIQIG